MLSLAELFRRLREWVRRRQRSAVSRHSGNKSVVQEQGIPEHLTPDARPDAAADADPPDAPTACEARQDRQLPIPDLLKFIHYLERNLEGRGTIEAHALLPEELHGLFPCPELDELKEWAEQRMAAGGLAPAAELVERLESASVHVGPDQPFGARTP